MEKETAYSNLAGSGDELLLMASTGVQEDFVQRVSSAVCESMRKNVLKIMIPYIGGMIQY